jgi:dTDP-4-amino-4,6-dideoxygalactose transaminase
MHEKLALDGGSPVRKIPLELKKVYHGADVYDEREKSAADEVLETKSLFRYYGYDLLNKSSELEKEFARYVGTKHALAVSSGTAALHVALGAIGVGFRDEVILSPISWVSPALAILYQDALPVFADIDINSLNVDPQAVAKKITKRTKAIIVVHYVGLPARMNELMEIAREDGIYVVEDCSHAYGALYKGHKVGSIGDIAAFSCQFQKQITAGEGGLIATNSDELFENAYRFHDLGMYEHLSKKGIDTLGYNYRITELQSAILLAQLKKIDLINERLKNNATYLSQNMPCPEILQARDTPEDCENTYYCLPIRVNKQKLSVSAERIRLAMEAEGTPVSTIDKPIYYFGLFADKSSDQLLIDCRKIKYHENLIRYQKGLCPAAEKAYDEYIMAFNSPRLTLIDLQDYIKALTKVSAFYRI